MDNTEDILETALNSGIKYSAIKYGITIKEVQTIVDNFRKELVIGPCPCDKAKLKGINIMCFMCEGPETTARF